MKLKKRIAAIGAAAMMAVSMMSVNASALLASNPDTSEYMILAFTSFTNSTAYSNGSVTNMTKTSANFQVKSDLYYITTGDRTGSKAGSWSADVKLSKNQSKSASRSSYSRYYHYKYSAHTQVIRNNVPCDIVKSKFAES